MSKTDKPIIKVSEGITEGGIHVGNNFDKYGSDNLIVKSIMNGFEKSLSSLVLGTSAKSIHEIGCGEGFWSIEYQKKGWEVRGSDFSTQVIDIAKENARNAQVNENMFSVKSIYDLKRGADSADLIVCCEVLEHLEFPEKAIASLVDLQCKHYIFSVPREPLWRILNIFRFKYLSDFGNTPGHIQHWSRASFISLLKKHFLVREIVTPWPWTMVYCNLIEK